MKILKTEHELRDAILRSTSDGDGTLYPPGAAKLLDAYVKCVMERWTVGERRNVEAQFIEAARRTLDKMNQ